VQPFSVLRKTSFSSGGFSHESNQQGGVHITFRSRCHEHAVESGSDKCCLDVVFDNAGSLYGTTFLGGTGTCQFYQYSGCGTVFKLTLATDGKWHKTTLYNFTGGSDGEFPNSGNLILDATGDLYGATLGGASYDSSGYGTVYRITP
jgi:hypothetical protein